jgi:S-adenosylmethionine synthetase
VKNISTHHDALMNKLANDWSFCWSLWMSKSFIFSSESVGEGHPDKVSDSISDSVLDACLEQDPHSRVACETLVKSNCVTIAGEITTAAKFDYERVVREAIRKIGYVNDDDIFHADQVFFTNQLTAQSRDIGQGVDAAAAEGKGTAEQGAGDQGIMFGYACNETEELMPAPVMFAHRILRKMAEVRHAGERAPWLRPDCKSQVALQYEDGKMIGIKNVVVSTQHAADAENSVIRSFITDEIIKPSLPAELLSSDTEYLINPTGRFVIGGPEGDSGLTGRKIIVDTYGGWGRHGGGAFSGKDPSKVDRSAAYMCRWVAKNVVAAGLSDRVEIQVAYAIGHPEPTSVTLDCFGTEKVEEAKIEEAVREVFSFKPADIVKQLDLLRPIYCDTTHYGHFGKAGLPWEELSKTEVLKQAV